MPWKPSDALKHTKLAKTKKLQRQWAAIANKNRLVIGDAKAIRIANATIKRRVI